MQKQFTQILLGALVLASGVSSAFLPHQAFARVNQPLSSISEQTSILPSSSYTYQSMEKYVEKEINKYRKSYHLPAYKVHSKITEYARAYSKAKHQGGYDKYLKELAKYFSYSKYGVMVVSTDYYPGTEKYAFEQMKKNPKYNQLMKSKDYDYMGCGVYKDTHTGKYYFTTYILKKK